MPSAKKASIAFCNDIAQRLFASQVTERIWKRRSFRTGLNFSSFTIDYCNHIRKYPWRISKVQYDSISLGKAWHQRLACTIREYWRFYVPLAALRSPGPEKYPLRSTPWAHIGSVIQSWILHCPSEHRFDSDAKISLVSALTLQWFHLVTLI